RLPMYRHRSGLCRRNPPPLPAFDAAPARTLRQPHDATGSLGEALAETPAASPTSRRPASRQHAAGRRASKEDVVDAASAARLYASEASVYIWWSSRARKFHRSWGRRWKKKAPPFQGIDWYRAS